METLSLDYLKGFWSWPVVSANIVVFMNLVGALVLGLVLGYERSYHGRAAGMRTYGLVCTASAGLVVICGYPDFWFGGYGTLPTAGIDPTRVIQGVVTGIGFLGAGVIMKEGFSISGLTTAASIWSTAAVGVLIGVEFYAAAILLTLLSVVCMTGVSALENWLPQRHAVQVTIRFRAGFEPSETELWQASAKRGYDIASGTLMIDFKDGQAEWHYVAIARNKREGLSIPELAEELTAYEGVDSYQLAYARN